MTLASLSTPAVIADNIRLHVDKILVTQSDSGLIPSYIHAVGGRVEKKKNIVRQSMATMALSFAHTLVPSLSIEQQIKLSFVYIEKNLESQTSIQKLYIALYLALADAYAEQNVTQSTLAVQKSMTPEIFEHPIAMGLYLRLSTLLPGLGQHAASFHEVQQYNMSTIPRKGRFFDYADTLVWAKHAAPELALQEYQYLEKCYTTDGWFKDPQTGGRVRSSVVGKFFEVLAYYGADMLLIERLYTRLMQERAASHYAKETLGKYGAHILSQPNTLTVDDVHFHVLVGLCYLLAEKKKHI